MNKGNSTPLTFPGNLIIPIVVALMAVAAVACSDDRLGPPAPTAGPNKVSAADTPGKETPALETEPITVLVKDVLPGRPPAITARPADQSAVNVLPAPAPTPAAQRPEATPAPAALLNRQSGTMKEVVRAVAVERSTLASAPVPHAPYSYSTGGTATVNDAPYDATSFKHYGVNPFIDTEEDHLSTFAMDVDTASYAVARRFLMDGHLPDPDSVRVEEFLNYFKQGYEPPREDAFAIYIEGAPSPFGSDRHWLMRVGLQGRFIEAEERKDASLVFVIDTSGSMGYGNRLGLVKKSLRLLVEELRPTDEVGIVIYGSQARVLLEPTRGNDKEAIIGSIDRLTPNGSTNAEHGLRLGYQMANERIAAGRINRVILLSDGVANVGRTGPDSILKTVRGHVEEGVTLSTVGFGMGNFNDVLMERLANDGNGNYAYVDSLDQARRVFVENLTGMLQVIAKDAKVQVDFNPEVVSRYRLLGYENRRVADQDFRNDTVDAGEVGVGHTVTALYELKLYDGAQGQVAAAYIRYEDPDKGVVAEISREFYRNELSEAMDDASPRFQLDAAVAEYAEILRESYWAQESTLHEVSVLAQRVSELLPDDPDVAEFADLVTRAEAIGGPDSS